MYFIFDHEERYGDDVELPAYNLTAARIGSRVRALREDHGWSPAAFALRVGLAPAVVQHLEAGRRLPTVAILYRLASALEVAPGELLPSPLDTPRVDVHLPILDGSSTAQVVGGGPGNATQTYLYDMLAGETDGGFGSHPGDELLVVVEGEVVCSQLGQEDVVVTAGRSKVIDTRVPHGMRASDVGSARFLLVCTDACDH